MMGIQHFLRVDILFFKHTIAEKNKTLFNQLTCGTKKYDLWEINDNFVVCTLSIMKI